MEEEIYCGREMRGFIESEPVDNEACYSGRGRRIILFVIKLVYMNILFKNDLCVNIKELLLKLEEYLEKNYGSLSRDNKSELESCISILKKMEKEACNGFKPEHLQMGLTVVNILSRFFLLG